MDITYRTLLLPSLCVRFDEILLRGVRVWFSDSWNDVLANGAAPVAVCMFWRDFCSRCRECDFQTSAMISYRTVLFSLLCQWKSMKIDENQWEKIKINVNEKRCEAIPCIGWIRPRRLQGEPMSLKCRNYSVWRNARDRAIWVGYGSGKGQVRVERHQEKCGKLSLHLGAKIVWTSLVAFGFNGVDCPRRPPHKPFFSMTALIDIRWFCLAFPPRDTVPAMHWSLFAFAGNDTPDLSMVPFWHPVLAKTTPFPLGTVYIISEYLADIREAMPDACALGRLNRTLVTSTLFLVSVQMHTFESVD